MRTRQPAIILVSLVAGLWIGAGAASADSTDYVLTSAKPTINEEDGEPTVALTLINLTDQEATVTLSTTEGGDNCKPSQEELAARQEEKLTFTLDGCDFGKDNTVGIAVDVEGTPFDVTGKIDETAEPDWGLLWIYQRSLAGGVVLVLLGWIWFALSPPKGLAKKRKVGPATPLPYLGASWSFKDSWAANVTLVSAAFTGLFGSSDLLKSVTGEEAPSTLALITIASAIAVALVGLGPLVLQTTRNDKSQVYAGGLFASAALAVGASGGLALIIVRSVAPAVKGSAETILSAGAWLALILLALYAVTSVRQNLTKGLTKPPDEETDLTDEQKQAIVDALSAKLGASITPQKLRDEVLPEIEQVIPQSYPRHGTGPGDYPAAMI